MDHLSKDIGDGHEITCSGVDYDGVQYTTHPYIRYYTFRMMEIFHVQERDAWAIEWKQI